MVSFRETEVTCAQRQVFRKWRVWGARAQHFRHRLIERCRCWKQISTLSLEERHNIFEAASPDQTKNTRWLRQTMLMAVKAFFSKRRWAQRNFYSSWVIEAFFKKAQISLVKSSTLARLDDISAVYLDDHHQAAHVIRLPAHDKQMLVMVQIRTASCESICTAKIEANSGLNCHQLFSVLIWAKERLIFSIASILLPLLYCHAGYLAYQGLLNEWSFWCGQTQTTIVVSTSTWFENSIIPIFTDTAKKWSR